MDLKERAFYLAEEFTDFLLEDKQRGSIIVNINADHFRVVYTEFKKIGYKLVHKTSIKDGKSFTLVFVYQIK